MERADDFEQLRLTLARQRRLGMGFDEAWRLALSALDRPTQGILATEALDASRCALETTEEAWRRGYERRPPPVPKYAEAAQRRRLREMLAAVAA
jgi:hypothetical protein